MKKLLLPLSIFSLLMGAAYIDLRRAPDLAPLSDLSQVVLANDEQIIHLRLNQSGKWRQLATIDMIDPKLIATLLAFEDQRFYEHHGVDPLALARAFKDLLLTGRVVSGGSTITMQLARLLDPSLQKRTITTKLKQIWSAIRLDAHLTKRQILEAYFTLAPYGGNIEGVVAATEAWFKKSPASLTESEAAFLVAMPQSPETRRPDRNPKNAIDAKNHVLKTVAEARDFSPVLLREYLAENLPLEKSKVARAAPHLLDRFVRNDASSKALHTTIDPVWQTVVQQMVNEHVERYPEPINGAAMVVERKTGLVRAYVGSSDYSDEVRKGGNNFLVSARSPGSTLKPLIYARALDKRKLSPTHVFSDTVYQQGAYAPTNFDGSFSGDVTLKEALVRSLNIPAVETLSLIGPQEFESFLRNFLNYEAAGEKASGLSLAVGGMYLSGEDIVRLYLSLIDPQHSPRLAFKEVDKGQEPSVLVSAEASAQIQHLMSVQLASGGIQVAKTGTSQNRQDAHTVLVTREHVIYSWLGTPDNEATDVLTGAASALPLAERIQSALGLSAPVVQAPEAEIMKKAPDLRAQCADMFIYPKDGDWLRVEKPRFRIETQNPNAKLYLNGHAIKLTSGLVSLPSSGAYTLSASLGNCSQSISVFVDLVE